MLDLKRVQAFVVVAETGSVAKAAARLRISESPLSRQVIALERELAVALFARRGRRLQLTDAGRRLLGQAQALLAQAAELERGVDAGRTAAGPVRLGLHGSVAWHAGIGRAVRALRERHPGIELALSVPPPAALASALRDGAVDLALLRRPAAQAGLSSRRIALEPLVLAASPALGELTLKRLAGLPWFEPVGRPPSALQTALDAAGLAQRQRIEVPDLAVSVALVRSGVGVLLTQAGVANALAGVRVVPPPFACPPLEVHLAWRRRTGPASAAVTTVEELLERCLV